MRKFADKEHIIKQTQNSNTETTLILCGYSRELANSNINNILDQLTLRENWLYTGCFYCNPLVN